jgi:hypothetical protein
LDFLQVGLPLTLSALPDNNHTEAGHAPSMLAVQDGRHYLTSLLWSLFSYLQLRILALSMLVLGFHPGVSYMRNHTLFLQD